MNDLLARLAEPFEPKHLTWKPGATKADKCMALAYADLRAYMERLDEVVGMEWSVAYEPWGDNRIIARLNIGGVIRSSTGEMDSGEEKGGNGGTIAEAQAFKRAATMFGLGRFIYELPSPWVDFDPTTKRISKSGLTDLENRYAAWYAKTMAATAAKRTVTAAPTLPASLRDMPVPVRSVDAATGEIIDPTATVDNPFTDPTPYFVHAFNRLTGKPYDLVKWVRTLHDKSEGACTKKQYGYLVSIADELSGGEHSYLLSVLCQSEISKTNMPGEKVTDALLKYLRVSSKDEAGNDIANPDYRPDMAEIVKVIAKGQPELVTG